MAAIAAVFTINHVAEMLGEDENWLYELSIDMFADTDEVGHAFQYDVGHLFRSEVGHHSEMKPATRRVATVGLD